MYLLLSVFNFLLIYGALFYVMNVKMTGTRLLLCALINGAITALAVFSPNSLWIAMGASITLSGFLFHQFTKDKIAFLHVCMIYLLSILAEYTALLVVEFFQAPLVIHGGVIIVQIAIMLFIYKKVVLFYQSKIKLSLLSNIVLLWIAGLTFTVFYTLIFLPAEKGEFEISTMNAVILFLYFSVMIFLTGIFLQTMIRENQINEKSSKQDQFTQYMHALELVNREMQTFRHDYANILVSLRGYIESEDLKGLTTYFNEQIVKTEQSTLLKNQVFSQLDNLKIVELKGVIATKWLQSSEASVPMNIEVPDPIHSISVHTIDLARVLGIFLDNAIEESVEMENPQINLAFIQQNRFVIMIVENRIHDSSVSIHELFTEQYSTKGNNRGFGLPTVRKIVSNYPNVTCNSRIENEWFIHELMIEERHANESGLMRR